MNRFPRLLLPATFLLGLPLAAAPADAWAQSGLELADEAEEAEAGGDYEAAAELFLRAHARLCDQPALLYLAARNLARTGKHERAVELLGRALEEGLLLAGPLARDTVFRSLEGDAGFLRLLERAQEREDRIDRALREELEELAKKDQAHREDLLRVTREAGWDSAALDSAGEVLKENDAAIQARFREIIGERGWPGRSLVGSEGAGAAWLLAQHADTTLQRELLPLLEEAVAEGEASKSHWAYLLDRVRLGRGEPQLFGTQLDRSAEEGRWVLQPVENPENLNRRRVEMCLVPIEEYLEMITQMYGGGPPP